VLSVKAARGLSPGCEPASGPAESAGPAVSGIRPADIRRDPALTLTGAGVVVAAVDWGVDVDSAALRWPDDPAFASGHRPGGTRFLSFWDQRDHAVGPRPDPYRYGSVHDREEIDRALQDPRPYDRLGYHPAIADPRGMGSHGHRTITIAAGNGQDGGPAGIAPEADLIFVHLADRNSGGLVPFGDSVRALEAVDFISRSAGSQPCSINISAGRMCGPHTGTALVEMAFDELLAGTPGRFVSQSCGNYARWRTHCCGTIASGEARSLTMVVDPADITLNEVEIWYDGADEFTVRIDPPGYTGGRPVCLGERSDLLVEGRVVGRIYHRKHDPNNGDNHIVAYLDPVGHAGNWTITLEARRTASGRFHGWIERDDSCPGCQARFTPGNSSPVSTIGSITTSHLPLIVGAYNAHSPARPVAPFSSHGPTRDGRLKPDLVAPGVDVLASRSSPPGVSRNPGLLVRGSGTSFAAPHVAGAVALCFQAAGNRLRAHEIRSLVLGSCDSVPESDPYRLGNGYLNIPRLVADVQQALVASTIAPAVKESTMATENSAALLAAAPATAYREYLYRPRGEFARWIGDRFEIVARPGQPIDRAPREGDVLLEVTLGYLVPGQCSTLTAADVQRVVSSRRLAPGQLLLRQRRRVEMSAPLPVEPAPEPGAFAFAAGQAPSGIEAEAETDAKAEAEVEAEHGYGEEYPAARMPVPVDAAAAVPPFTAAERARVVEPLLATQASAKATAWNRAMHSASSGVTLDDIRTALGSYVDAVAIQAAINRENSRYPSQPIDASSPVTDAVLAECVHQFQKKCYCDKREHDGQAGESTLDSLGLIARTGPGFHGGLRHNARAQERLAQHDSQVQAATSGEFSGTSWFSGIIDPSVFGMRTKEHHGLHVLFVRRLRQAERYLLTLHEFRDKTPAALGEALGLTEAHAGMRAAQTGSMHTLGLAIDIEYLANPWIHHTATWQVMKRAAKLISGTHLPHASAPEYFSSLGSDPALSTGQVFDELHQRSTELVAYLRMGQDSAALQAALRKGRASGTAGLAGPAERIEEASARWQAQIQDDQKALAARGGDFTGRDPGKGFLAHRRDLVIALREHGCLSWGAVDQGPNDQGSGDMMHFDARIYGVGRILAQRPRSEWTQKGRWVNYVSSPGHHPCLPASASRSEAASSAEPDEATASESGEAAASDYLGGKLWTFTAATMPLPVAVFCPRAALSHDQVEILLYAHGLLEPCRHRPEHVPSEFITDPPFSFGHIVHGSGRPIVLVVPLLDWAHPGGERVFGSGREHWHPLAAPRYLNSLIREVLAELGRVQDKGAAPSVRNLIIAGHSRAYDFLEPLVHHRSDQAMQEGALASLSQVWAFDTSYVGQVDDWIRWLAVSPHLQVHLFYLPCSRTAAVGREFYRQQGPRLTVTRVCEKHCYIPATRLPALLNPHAEARGVQTDSQGEAWGETQALLPFGDSETGDWWPDPDEALEAEDGGAEAEDNLPSRDRFATVSSTVRSLTSGAGTDVRTVLAALKSLNPVEMCRLGEAPDLVATLADHLAGTTFAQASAQLARGRVNSMGRADLGPIVGAPSLHSLGTLAGAYGHDALLAHHEAFDRSGTGTIHGNRSSAPAPTGAVATDCTEFVLTVLTQVFAAKGLTAEWRAVRKTAEQDSGRGGLKGTEVIKALQAARNWQAVFWAPDPRNPADGNSEHPFAYRKVGSTKAYYGIAVDPSRSVINYRRTNPGHQADLTGIERLKRLQFGLLAARGGIHLAMIVNGDVHEVHWTVPATLRDSITSTPLETFEWQSGIIAAPPGDLDLAWRTP
jgi:subtilisin family serine protease